jgi:SH3 domain protein
MKTTIIAAATSLIGILMCQSAWSESVWVSDEFEVTLRTGPSTGNAIEIMVSSGTELEALERDADTGYTRVQTRAGTEGWVLTRYLMVEPSAREQLQTLTGQLTDASSRGSSLNNQLAAIRSEYDTAERRIEELERDKTELQQELADIRRTAANALAVNDENTKLRDRLMDSDIRVDTLEQESRDLSDQSSRYWFMSGGLVLVIGMVLGLWLPRIQWQRRARYDRF